MRDLDVSGSPGLLESRRAVLDRILQTLARQPGLLVLTGDAGVGKSWLCRHLRRETPPTWRWVSVDLSPALGPLGLYRLILRDLGRAFPSTLDVVDARFELEEALAESSLDGVHWGLILDESHAATAAVLEEVRIVSNRVGSAEGFAGLLLAGQTGLLHRLARRPLAALESKVILQQHLRPLGLNETAEFLRLRDPGAQPDRSLIEQLHRATAGNPLRLSLRLREILERRPSAARRSASVEGPPTTPTPLSVLPVRPPLIETEGMVEVGWAPPDEAEAPRDPVEGQGVPDADADRRFFEESAIEPAQGAWANAPEGPSYEDRPVEDHYATLQAWQEWSRNRRLTDPTTGDANDLADDHDTADDPSESEEVRASSKPANPDLRPEGEHGFAPYSQLFSRLRQARDNA